MKPVSRIYIIISNRVIILGHSSTILASILRNKIDGLPTVYLKSNFNAIHMHSRHSSMPRMQDIVLGCVCWVAVNPLFHVAVLDIKFKGKTYGILIELPKFFPCLSSKFLIYPNVFHCMLVLHHCHFIAKLVHFVMFLNFSHSVIFHISYILKQWFGSLSCKQDDWASIIAEMMDPPSIADQNLT